MILVNRDFKSIRHTRRMYWNDPVNFCSGLAIINDATHAWRQEGDSDPSFPQADGITMRGPMTSAVRKPSSVETSMADSGTTSELRKSPRRSKSASVMRGVAFMRWVPASG